ncbi:MAG: TerB N-terminal domain-containing protein, partial [Gemmatimonadaceae bacterium]|nr:TerB N-terminal domain-containing protein [Gemmatimonadaceae bacterium]
MATWIAPEDRIFVQGRVIEGGMVYVGSDAWSANGYWIEPCLIDPDLPVDWRSPDWSGWTLDFWLSYEDADPRARAAFLEWLAGGRSD